MLPWVRMVRDPMAGLPDERRAVGIAGAQRHLVGIDPEQAGDQLREHGLMALAARPRHAVEHDLVATDKADRDLILGKHAAAGWLQEHRAADAAHRTAPGCLRAPPGKTPPARRHPRRWR